MAVSPKLSRRSVPRERTDCTVRSPGAAVNTLLGHATSLHRSRCAPRRNPMPALREVLPSVFFLHDQDDATRLSFADLAITRSFPKGNILFHHGDPCFAAYVIIDGRVKLTVAD